MCLNTPTSSSRLPGSVDREYVVAYEPRWGGRGGEKAEEVGKGKVY